MEIELITYTGENRRETFSTLSQLSSFTLAEVQENKPRWPLRRETQPPSLLDKLDIINCHPVWYSRSNMPRIEIFDSIWRTAHAAIWINLFREVFRRWSRFASSPTTTTGRPYVKEAPHIVGFSRVCNNPFDPDLLLADDAPTDSLNYDPHVSGEAKPCISGPQ